jgi:NADH:ubiquinone oxidoreductase subunit
MRFYPESHLVFTATNQMGFRINFLSFAARTKRKFCGMTLPFFPSLDIELETFITASSLPFIESPMPSSNPDPEFSLVRRLSQFATRLQTLLSGVEVGCDPFGNRYYHERRTPKGIRQRRWVMYNGEPEASKVPPEWHIWLHHTADAPIPLQSPLRRPWQKPFQQNQTGTAAAYFPPGYAGGKRRKATGDYEAWQPNE